MSKLNICEKGSFYICHRCLSFKCNSKNDMTRHYQRITQCMPNIITNDDNIENNDYFYNKSISHRYITEMNINFLSNIHIKLIITNCNNIYNVITYDLLNSIVNNDTLKIIKNNDNYNNYFNQFVNKENNEYKENKDNLNKNTVKNKKYICDNCFTKFTTLYTLTEHKTNINICNKKKQLNLVKENYKKIENIPPDNLIKKYIEETNNNSHITQNIQNNIQNQNVQNNIQNIQNQYNKNINNQKNDNNFYLNTRDFLYERYDYSHLNIHNVNDKFFEYSNFLENLLKNKANQNLYFTNNGYGIYYADNVLNKSQSELIVSFIISKLKSTLESIINQFDETKQNEKRHLKKYYNKLDGQYKINSHYQNYDFDDKYFYNTEIKNRIRDKFISETIRVYNVYLDDTKTKFLEAELSKGNIHHNKMKIEGYLTQKELNQDFL